MENRTCALRAAVLVVLLIPLLVAPTAADELVVFKKEGRFKGAALRVAKVELDKHGRLLLTGTRGELFSASPDEVDWELSRRMTEELQAKETERALLNKDEQSRKKKAATSDKRQLSVLEASKLYGVDNPAMFVPEGSGYRNTTANTGTGEAASTPAPIEDTPAMTKIAERVESLTKQREAVNTDLEALRKDNNPDPVSAGLRNTRTQEKTAQLATLDSQITEQKAALEKLRSEAKANAAEKPKDAAPKAEATPSPSPTPKK